MQFVIAEDDILGLICCHLNTLEYILNLGQGFFSASSLIMLSEMCVFTPSYVFSIFRLIEVIQLV